MYFTFCLGMFSSVQKAKWPPPEQRLGSWLLLLIFTKLLPPHVTYLLTSVTANP